MCNCKFLSKKDIKNIFLAIYAFTFFAVGVGVGYHFGKERGFDDMKNHIIKSGLIRTKYGIVKFTPTKVQVKCWKNIPID